MIIEWKNPVVADWQKELAKSPQANLVQTWSYAKAVRDHNQMMTRFGYIQADDGAPLGTLEMQEAKALGFFHAVTLHRGPVWFDQCDSKSNWIEFLKLFRSAFKPRLGRAVRFLPELEDTPDHRQMLEDAGYSRVGEGYETLMVDLRPDLEEIRKAFKQKWRNALNGAEKNGLSVSDDLDPASRSWLLSNYQEDKNEKRYGGASGVFLQTMITESLSFDQVLLLRVSQNDTHLSGGLFFVHGRTATYQAGWTGEQGRTLKANYLIMWEAIQRLRALGVEQLDLGGINLETASGVTRFKQGMAGKHYKTVGLYK